MSFSSGPKDAVRGSWLRAKAKWATEGQALFFDLFTKKPEYFAKFNSLFKGKSLDKIHGSSELAAQAQSFKGMVSMWVDNLDREDILAIQTERFAKLHKARGVTADEIQFAFDLFVERMKANFGADAASWNAIISVIMKLIRKSM